MAYQQIYYCPFHHVKMMKETINGRDYLVCSNNPDCRWGMKEVDSPWWQLQDGTIQPHQVEEHE